MCLSLLEKVHVAFALCCTGLRSGSGVFTAANGERYEGGWERGLKHGAGVLRRANGRSRAGLWRSGVLIEWQGSEVFGDIVKNPSSAAAATATAAGTASGSGRSAARAKGAANNSNSRALVAVRAV
jgi:MORN repeat